MEEGEAGQLYIEAVKQNIHKIRKDAAETHSLEINKLQNEHKVMREEIETLKQLCIELRNGSSNRENNTTQAREEIVDVTEKLNSLTEQAMKLKNKFV